MDFLNCYICNKQTKPANGVRMRAKTKYSAMGVHEIIQGFLKETHLLRFSANDVICAKCFQKLNQYDLACRMAEEIQQEITNSLHATEQVFLSDETVEYLVDDSIEENIIECDFKELQRNYEKRQIHAESQSEDDTDTNVSLDSDIKTNTIAENSSIDQSQSANRRRKVACDECSEFFSTKRAFKKHELQYHTSKKCGICQKVFDNQIELRDHKRRDHEIENMSTDEVASDEPNSVTRDQEGVHRCDYCNEIESTEDLLEQHVAQHDNQFKCVICGAILKHKGNLVLHMRIHMNKKFFKCDKCEKTFVHKSSLRMHLQTTHTEVRNKQCPQCPLKFKTTSQLNQHLVTHSGVKNHKCPECGKAFGQRYNMTAHYRTHHEATKMVKRKIQE